MLTKNSQLVFADHKSHIMHALARHLLMHAEIVTAMALVLAASWAFVAWMTLDMSHPFVMVMMPIDASWSWAVSSFRSRRR